ncbi:MAG: DNA ligase, partial [Halodesulfurarchaeum sp.]
MDYADLVGIYRDLEETASTDEKTRIVAEALRSADEDHRGRLVKLLQGNLYAAWRETELGVSSSLTRTAIAKATGIDED